jgi:hypothetical protein
MRIVTVGWEGVGPDPLPVAAVPGERPGAPWDWFPEDLPMTGLQLDDAPPRVWFAGRPVGFQWRALRQILEDVAHGGGPVSPLVRSTVAAIRTPLDVAILTVPS